MKSKVTWCSVALFKSPYSYGVCTTPERFAHEMKRLNVKSPPPFLTSANAHATTHYFTTGDDNSAIVTIGKLDGRLMVEVIGLLAHEATHIWQTVCEHVGEKAPSAEFEAYAIQWITQQLVEALSSQDKRFKLFMKKVKS
jgi:hypothetical protein